MRVLSSLNGTAEATMAKNKTAKMGDILVTVSEFANETDAS